MAENLPKTVLIHELLDQEVTTLDNAKLDKTTGIPSEIVASTEQTVIADTDIFPIVETTTLKKTLWSTIKSTLKTYFDGLYLALTGGTLTGGLTITAATDAVNSSKITDKDGNVILSVDTTNNRVGVGTNAPDSPFHLKADLAGYTNFLKIEDISNPGTGATTLSIKNTVCELLLRAYGSTAPGILASATGFASGSNNMVNGVGSGKKLYFFSNDNYNSPEITINNKKNGINTTAPDKALEINSVDGNCLRLTYNDSNGSATYYADFNVSSAGVLTINASGGIIKTANDVEITDSSKGIILTSPDNSRWRVTADNSGNLITTSI